MQLLSPKAVNGLRKLAVFASVSLTIAVVAWRYTSWWCFWTGHDHLPMPVPLRLQHIYQENIQVRQIESNCGVRETCTDNSFPVYLSTGSGDDLSLQLCVMGKYILQRGVNGGGRGLNAVVIEPTQFQIVSVRSFDTYRTDSALEMDSWLEQMLDDDILIIFTSDEASARLNHSTRVMLNSLGSGKIQDLSFRAQWFLITQKRDKGFSIYEKLSFPRSKNWGDELEFRGCVPRQVPKEPVTIDPPVRDLTSRNRFCKGKTDNAYQALCTQSRFQVLAPALLTNRSLIGNIVYSVPIYLFAGNKFEVMVAALDSLIHQPGILLSALTVVYNSSQNDVADLALLFNVKSIGVTGEMTWRQMIDFARRDTMAQHPSQNFVIVIAPDSIPSPDFLFFLAQTAPTLLRDSTLSAVSAYVPPIVMGYRWSANCYHSSGDEHLAMRVHDVPRFAALFYVQDVEGDIVVPDVSRIQGPEVCHPPSLKSDNWIERPQDLSLERYFHKLVMLQQRSEDVNLTQMLITCPSITFAENGNYVIYFKENFEILSKILSCLGVIDRKVGHYQRIMRVTVSKASVLLIHNNSSFYKARPIHS